MTGPAKRRDYLSNARKSYRKQSGCTWCGAAGYGGPTEISYCSDACVQKDHEGIDDLPAVIPLSVGKTMSARPWMSYEDRLRNG